MTDGCKLTGYRCKFCKSDALVFINNQKYNLPAYLYHYSEDYELGCKQRISFEQFFDYIERPWEDE